MTVLYDHYSLTSLWKGYFLVPLLFEKSERDTGLTKWLCTPGNRSTETAGRIWADNKVPSATFSAAADSKDEEDLVKVLDAEDPLAALASGWRIDGKNRLLHPNPGRSSPVSITQSEALSAVVRSSHWPDMYTISWSLGRIWVR